MQAPAFLQRLANLFADRGAAQYSGEAVSQLEHALQTATAAERDGATAELITAALLHDVGHLLHGHGEDCAEQGLDDQHEELGFRFLARHFTEAVTEPIRLHVPAKRFLCAVEPDYREALSPASTLSLQLQGGAMNAEEVVAFRANPHFPAAVALRRWDDAAKIPGLATPPFEHFARYLEPALARNS